MPLLADIVEVVECALPGSDFRTARMIAGEFHDVVLFPDQSVVKIARGAAARHLPRRAHLLQRLSQLDFPFTVPRPLGEPVHVGDRTAVALSWVPGFGAHRGPVEPAQLVMLLQSLAEVPVAELGGLLDEPHAYAGRSSWAELMLGDVVPRLPRRVQDEARRRIEAALQLPDVPRSLVHGDLASENILLSENSEVLSVIDWDLTQPFDPAIDAACLAWFGWETVRAAVSDATYTRARTWFATFGIEQVASALDNGEDGAVIAVRIDRAVRWMTRPWPRSLRRPRCASSWHRLSP